MASLLPKSLIPAGHDTAASAPLSPAQKQALERKISKQLIENGAKDLELDHAFIRDDIAKEVTPSEFIDLIENDPSRDFRISAIHNFGTAISPKVTLPALSHLAKDDPDFIVRMMSFLTIGESFQAGKLSGCEAQVEQLAIGFLKHRSLGLAPIDVLQLCHTASARQALRGVLSGNYDERTKRAAAKALGLTWPPSRRRE